MSIKELDARLRELEQQSLATGRTLLTRFQDESRASRTLLLGALIVAIVFVPGFWFILSTLLTVFCVSYLFHWTIDVLGLGPQNNSQSPSAGAAAPPSPPSPDAQAKGPIDRNDPPIPPRRVFASAPKEAPPASEDIGRWRFLPMLIFLCLSGIVVGASWVGILTFKTLMVIAETVVEPAPLVMTPPRSAKDSLIDFVDSESGREVRTTPKVIGGNTIFADAGYSLLPAGKETSLPSAPTVFRVGEPLRSVMGPISFVSEERADRVEATVDALNHLCEYLKLVTAERHPIATSDWSPPMDWVRKNLVVHEEAVQSQNAGHEFFTVRMDVNMTPERLKQVYHRYEEDRSWRRTIALGRWFVGAVFTLGGMAVLLRLGTSLRRAV